MELFLMTLTTGIMVGGIYALIALGWVLIYKCSGVLNLAMGELTLIGAYVSMSFYEMGIPFYPVGSPFSCYRADSGRAHRTHIPRQNDWRAGIGGHHGYGGAFLFLPRDGGVRLGNGHQGLQRRRYSLWSPSE